MKNKLKFYEEKMNEKDLLNINGQQPIWMRNADQDRYGNNLVFHKERTYFGEFLTTVKQEELLYNPKTIFNYVDTQVREFLKRLLVIVPDSNLELDKLQVFIKKTYGYPDIDNRNSNVYVYEDDGNTGTEGFRYDICWALPLSDRNRDLEYAVINGYACDSVVFKLKFDERIHDSRISSRFFSLYFNGVMSEDVHGKKNETRIDYNNDNMSMNSIITAENLFGIGKKLIEYKQDEELLRKATLAFEQ